MTTPAAAENTYLLPVYPRMGFEPVRGEGVWLETRDGRRLLDLYGGHAVALLGYRHPKLIEALDQQADTLFFQSNAVELAVRAEAGRRLVELAPAPLTHAFFVNSGAEANENALRLAFRSTGRSHVVALEGGFHGRTAAAGAATWGADKWYAFPRKPFDVTFVPRDDESALTAAITDETAAVIAEPVQGLAGAFPLGKQFLQTARERCNQTGARLIFDEVQCGMGRTGEAFGATLYDVRPDILTTAKGLAGGFPAGAVLVTSALAEGLPFGALGTTFGGGPLACALMIAVIEALTAEDVLANVRERSREIRERCQIGPITSIHGEGLLLGLVAKDGAKPVRAALLERGIVTGGADDPSVVRLLPPLTLESSHVDLLVQALEEIGS
ncbi:MAG: aminotransferase class III-fold pyridoxal phosphate-dependent enzyme [Planctomycetota bacterium]